jgi:hypothetical protein
MIIVPAWICEDTPEGIRAVLGSEPKEDANEEWIPRENIKNCLYAPVPQEFGFKGRKMAMLVFEEDKAPESVRAIVEPRRK